MVQLIRIMAITAKRVAFSLSSWGDHHNQRIGLLLDDLAINLTPKLPYRQEAVRQRRCSGFDPCQANLSGLLETTGRVGGFFDLGVAVP